MPAGSETQCSSWPTTCSAIRTIREAAVTADLASEAVIGSGSYFRSVLHGNEPTKVRSCFLPVRSCRLFEMTRSLGMLPLPDHGCPRGGDRVCRRDAGMDSVTGG